MNPYTTTKKVPTGQLKPGMVIVQAEPFGRSFKVEVVDILAIASDINLMVERLRGLDIPGDPAGSLLAASDFLHVHYRGATDGGENSEASTGVDAAPSVEGADTIAEKDFIKVS
jgi:hypothetical protein